MKNKALNLIALLLLILSMTSCKDKNKSISNEIKEFSEIKIIELSPEEVVLEYQKWNLENICSINLTYEDLPNKEYSRLKINNVKEWLVKLELTGWFSKSYLKNKKEYYEDLQYLSDQRKVDPQMGWPQYLVEQFDNVFDYGKTNTILINTINQTDGKAELELYKYNSSYPKNVKYDIKEHKIVIRNNDFKKFESLKPFQKKQIKKITLIKIDDKWLIDSVI